MVLCRIERAFPVQEVQSRENMPGVQMNPLDEKVVRQKMAKNHSLRSVSTVFSSDWKSMYVSTPI